MIEVLESLLKRRKVVTTTTTIVEVEESEEDIDDDQLRETVVGELMELDNRVRVLELELELYGRDA